MLDKRHIAHDATLKRLVVENENLRQQLALTQARLNAYEQAEPVAWIEERFETDFQGVTIGYARPVLRHEKPPKTYSFGRKTDLIPRPQAADSPGAGVERGQSASGVGA